jgi:aminocarboxymuconate-semialdehyde decarboxylase
MPVSQRREIFMIQGPIDVHTHIVPPDLLNAILRDGSRLQTRTEDEGDRRWLVIQESTRRPLNDRLTDLQTRTREFSAQGIAAQALSCPPFVMYYDADADAASAIAEVANDSIIEAARRFPDQFIPVATAALQNPARAVRELERAAKAGARTIQIGTHVNGKALDEPELSDFFTRAVELNVAIVVHPFDAVPTGRTGRYYLGNVFGNPSETGLAASLLIFGGVLEANPGLQVVLLHAGGVFPMILGRLDHGYRTQPECRAAISKAPSGYLDQLWADSIAHDAATLAFTVERIGGDRVVMGSDYPFAMGYANPLEMLEAASALSGQQKAAIAETNARKLLRLDS